MNSDPRTITKLLQKVAEGDASAKEQLYRALYGQLTRVARKQLAQAGTISLDAPAILHDAYMRMESTASSTEFANRNAFFGYAAAVMHTVVVDFVRQRKAKKRGSGIREITLKTGIDSLVLGEDDLLKLYEAIEALKRVAPRCHHVVQMRYFAGLSERQIAEALDVSMPTVQRDWYKARAFLLNYLEGDA